MCWLRVDIRSEHGCEDLEVFLVLFKRLVVLALRRIHVANFSISVKHIKVLPAKQHDHLWFVIVVPCHDTIQGQLAQVQRLARLHADFEKARPKTSSLSTSHLRKSAATVACGVQNDARLKTLPVSRRQT